MEPRSSVAGDRSFGSAPASSAVSAATDPPQKADVAMPTQTMRRPVDVALAARAPEAHAPVGTAPMGLPPIGALEPLPEIVLPSTVPPARAPIRPERWTTWRTGLVDLTHRNWSFPLLITGRLLVLVAIVCGAALRAWYGFHFLPTSDEAVVGLMAHGIQHGHFNAFYWGQDYGGSAEAVAVAFLMLIFGNAALWLTPAILFGVAALLTWRIARRLVPDRLLASLAGALVWVAPLVVVRLSSLELGFRGVMLVCGLIVLLLSLRILDGAADAGNFIGLGLAAGIGWWSSPEVVFFFIPAAALLIGAIVNFPAGWRIRFWLPALTATLAFAVLGALPWLWANAQSGFRSLQPSSFAGASLAQPHGYGERLQSFFVHLVPMLQGSSVAGLQVVGGPLGAVIVRSLELLLLGAVVICGVKRGRCRAIALALVSFPFVYALSPATWFWADGRYGMCFAFLAALALVVACAEGPGLLARHAHNDRLGHLARPWSALRNSRKRTISRLLMIGTSLLTVALTVVGFSELNAGQLHGSFFAGWSNRQAPIEQVADRLYQGGVRTGYANYWVAYPIDFGSGEKPLLSPGPWDTVRSRSMYQKVRADPHAAWIFLADPRRRGAAGPFGGSPASSDPGGLSESSFVVTLDQLDIKYRVVHAGVLDGVIPQRPVTTKQVGIP